VQVSPTQTFTLWLKAKTFFRSYFLIATSFYVLFVGVEIIVCRCRDYRFTSSQSMTHTLGRNPLDEGSARRRDFTLATNNTHNR